MRVWQSVLVIALAVVAGVSAAGGASGHPAVKMRDLKGVNFVSACGFSHRAMDDPIVYPGRPGLSHDHSFVGNATTNAFSTLKRLRAGATTCRRTADTAAYWMPTLLEAGQPVEPRGATIYYRRKTLDAVRPFPAGLRMIAGNSKASNAQDLRVVYWNCGAQAGVGPSAAVPTCADTRGEGLRLHVNFPNCWDGANLDSPNHQAHMAYSTAGRCPADHPVPLPAISVIFRYPVTGGAGISLASGGQYTGHADFFNAWKQATLRSLTESCLNALRHCAKGG